MTVLTTPTPKSAADVAAHAAASYVRTPAPLSPQTRAAVLAELRAAVAEGNWGRVLDIELIAVEEDQRHPDQPRLMNEVRAVVGSAREVAA
ncbi:hypothetical protein [Streptomyces aculeolatus]|uniref:hypothetical protein n=1 Tax=Streptomyces aculeolatus TaxID=270689 RepID=UPI001CED2908|nr:hypothetical protein [Streptomyces aculeolatus]